MQICRGAALALCKWCAVVLAGLLSQAALAASSHAAFKPVEIGVSWSNFQEERWKRDEAAIKHALAMEGVEYVGMDAQASNEKQMKDIDALVARGVKAIIVLAWDAEAILPAVRRALDKGVPVIAYDRLIQDKDVFYITFDNIEVGRIQAREVLKQKPA
ncbi:MAG TPA: substrate-binding domain-containing protein, partial [Noviherbaspirillum sp.]